MIVWIEDYQNLCAMSCAVSVHAAQSYTKVLCVCMCVVCTVFLTGVSLLRVLFVFLIKIFSSLLRVWLLFCIPFNW